MSDQKEKPNGALPKGYDANTSSTEVVKQKKINFLELVRYTSTDQDQREKDLKEYEDSYIARLEKNEPEESSDDFHVELGVSTESDDDLGKLNLRKHAVTKREELQKERLAYEQKYLGRYAEPKIQKKKTSSDLYKPEIPKPKRDMKKERKKYEQKYLSRYKQPKLGVKKLSNLKHDIDAGALTLRQYVNVKRKARQDEIKKYEQKYLSRYKQPKIQKKKVNSSLYKPEIPKPKRDMKKERKKYEQKYLSRYKQPKIQKKKVNSSLYKPEISKPKRDMKKERKKYEQKYLSRYKQPKSRVKKSTSWTQHDVALGRLTLSTHFNAKRKAKQDEISKYEKQYLSRYKQPKSRVKKSTSWTQHDVALGRLTLSTHFNAKRKAKQDEISKYEKQYLSRYKQPKIQKKKVSSDLYKPETPKPKRDMKKERKEYEQKYLSRYKQPKANLRKSLNLKSDDLGRLNLRKHTIAKRSEYLAKRKDYEEKYILRYMKKLKAEPKQSSSKNLDHDLISGRLNLRAFVDKKRHEIKTERTEYEKKYISKYKESKASIKKSKSLTESDDLGKFTISAKPLALKKLRAERAEYEKQYLVRYSKQRKVKPKKKVERSDLYKPETPEPKRDMKKERKEYEQKYLARHLKQRKTKPKKKNN